MDYDGSMMESDTTLDQLGFGLINPDIKLDEPMSDQIRYHITTTTTTTSATSTTTTITRGRGHSFQSEAGPNCPRP